MDIEVNDNKQQASFRNGKFYHTFTPTTANQTVKLYHMGCVGDTRLNRIQLEQGTEPTGFVAPKQSTNTLSGIFKSLRDLNVKMTDPESDLWTSIKQTARGTVQEYHNSTIKNEIVTTAEGIIERRTRTINSSVDEKIDGVRTQIDTVMNNRVIALTSQSKRYADEVADVLSRRIDGVTTNVSTVSRTVDSINSNITSLEGNVLKKNEISITSNGVTLGSGKVIDGRTITSLITTQPENIKAITDKFIITPANENLVKREYRDNFILNVRDGILNRIYGSNTDLVGEYHFKVSIMEFDPPTLYASIHVKYKDGTEDWFNSEFPTASWGTFETSTSVKVQVKANKEIEYIEPLVFQNKWSNFYNYTLKNLFVGKKKSAELIVDGTIEGKHIKSSSIETGHLKAGSVTSNIIAADAIKSKHLQVDDAMIEKLVSNQAFVTELWSQDAFINNLKTIKVTATSIDTEQLRGKTIQGVTIDGAEISGGTITGRTKIKLGEYGFMQPTREGGLQINSPRLFNSKDGIGVQIIGATERGEDIPYGLFVYQDKDFTVGDRAVDTDSYIMTVQGFIRTKGINNLRFVNYRDNSTSIGLWNQTVSLLFDNTDNDIYYSWKSKYSLWNIIKQHYNTTSDVRLKKDIVNCDYKALDLINDFKFKSFNWKYHEEFGQKPYTEIGLIAQEVEEISENFVSMAGEYKTLNQFNLLTYSLKAIQELSTQNNELQQRIIKLEEKING